VSISIAASIAAASFLKSTQAVGGTSQSSGVQPASQLSSDFASMISSIQSGSISGAQTALSALQQDQAALGTSSTTGISTAPAGTIKSALGQDMASLIQAVQSGNLSGAQQELTQLQSDASTLGGGHHHHHHHAAPVGRTTTASTASTGNTSAPASASAYASVMNFQAGTPPSLSALA
jgi:hypothetical protein